MRKINTTAKPVSAATLAKRAAKLAKQAAPAVTETPDAGITEAPVAAKPSGSITRTAATIVRGLCNFGGLTDRDAAYITFFATFCKRPDMPTVTLAEIRETTARPDYAGSAKAYDAGVIQRLTKAGLLKHTADGTAFEFTDAAKTHAAYSKADHR